MTLTSAPSIEPRLRPTPLEVACGLAIGTDPLAPELSFRGAAEPRTALEGVIRPALRRPPCLVSFSGGRDSSAVLAVAAALARREGLPLPVPVSYRFPAAPGTEEAQWQELVVRHLDLPDWERQTVTNELDSVGPVALGVLRRHGLLWPFNAHFHVPLLQRAAGGSLLTGSGGDELLGPQEWFFARAVLAGHRRPRRAHLGEIVEALSPLPVRTALVARRPDVRWPWLRPAVADEINQKRAAHRARTPRRWHRAVAWGWASRSRAVLSATMDVLAADAGVQLVNPFHEPGAVAAVGRRFGGRGPANRFRAMRALFGDLLPHAVLVRRGKAFFDEAFFSDHSRALAGTWRGGGVDPALVDADRLAEEWAFPRPDPRSFLLLQSVALATGR